MTAIKAILLAAICYFFFVTIFKNRSALTTRVLSALLLSVLAYFTLDPDRSTAVAHALGVGRGADLVFYLFMVFTAVFFFRVYSKTKDIDAQTTRIVRCLAIQSARAPLALSEAGAGEGAGRALSPGERMDRDAYRQDHGPQ